MLNLLIAGVITTLVGIVCVGSFVLLMYGVSYAVDMKN